MTGIPVYRCDACGDRGYWLFHQTVNGYCNNYHEPCSHCKGDYRPNLGVGPELRAALGWFRDAEVPGAPFTIKRVSPNACRNVEVKDVAKYWRELEADVKTNNVYVIEQREEELVALLDMFGGEEF